MERQKLPAFDSLQPLLMLSALSVCLFVGRLAVTGSDRFRFLNWNLALAWLPLLCAFQLRRTLLSRSWASWQAIMLTIGWLVLLPNSFYLVSDFVHLRFGITNEVSLLYDVVLLMSFALTGLGIGCASTYMVHMELKKRLTHRITWTIIGGIFLLSGLAIYLGRFLGWNSWDLIVNPAGIASDLLDRLINPSLYPNTFTITGLFFVFIFAAYGSFYGLIQNIKASNT